MKIRELDSLLAKLEGKKHQASISDVRELRKLLTKVLAADYLALECFIKAVVKESRKLGPKKAMKLSRIPTAK